MAMQGGCAGVRSSPECQQQSPVCGGSQCPHLVCVDGRSSSSSRSGRPLVPGGFQGTSLYEPEVLRVDLVGMMGWSLAASTQQYVTTTDVSFGTPQYYCSILLITPSPHSVSSHPPPCLKP